MDGNEAAAYSAYALSSVAILYPITPASPMGEITDKWSSSGKKNIFDETVRVIQMQSEGGAAGALHGSLTSGCLTTTFTSSQGLLLMYPNLFKIAGELLPGVIHVASRAIAGQALSIYGDHNDVMSVRSSGMVMIDSTNVQEAMDIAAISHIATLKARLPFIHFFDGFRTSHEINTVNPISNDILKQLYPYKELQEFHNRSLSPDHPNLHGSSQMPDVYFQMCESANPFYQRVPGIIQNVMDEFGKQTGRFYKLYEYYGSQEAEDIIVVMGSASVTTKIVVDQLMKKGTKIGVSTIRLFRPFCPELFLNSLPSTVKRITVLDRTKESGSQGEPLYLDIIAAVQGKSIQVYGGRYGLGSKEYTPSMANTVFLNSLSHKPKDHFTIGITDDVTNTSLPVISTPDHLQNIKQCLFWGVGSDGTTGANHTAIKIIVDKAHLYGQGYFYYSAHKSGGLTISHLRFGQTPIEAPYLIEHSDYTACHHSSYLSKYKEELIKSLKPNGVFVLNSSFNTIDEINKQFPKEVKKMIADKNIRLFNIDAMAIASKCGLGNRINMIMQTVFFSLSQILPFEQAKKYLKQSVYQSYFTKGNNIVESNYKAIDDALVGLTPIPYNREEWLQTKNTVAASANKNSFLHNVVEPMSKLQGNELPVSVFPLGGTIPPSVTESEKRGLSTKIPSWNPTKCTQCNQCSYMCPHAAIRPFLLTKDELLQLPNTIPTKVARGKDKELKYTIQVSPLDCTGCSHCIQICPSKCLSYIPNISQSPEIMKMTKNWNAITTLPTAYKSNMMEATTIRGSQFQKPLLEFSGACAGCVETVYVRLLTQLFGDQMMIANATGCSSIWGGSYPYNPYTTNSNGKGPAWANSLFEDNAEFGYGMFVGMENRRNHLFSIISNYLKEKKTTLSSTLFDCLQLWCDNFDNRRKLIDVSQTLQKQVESEINSQTSSSSDVLSLLSNNSDLFTKKSQWIIGGDGWAYDIGYGGLDHVIATGENVNILVLDTEMYSNTGGQASKSTPRSGVAKFASTGKTTMKKDLGAIAMTYNNVYVAQIAIGGNMRQTIQTLIEAEEYDGPSIIIAYCPCIGQGIKGGLEDAINEQKRAVESGYWLLYHYNPSLLENQFKLDSKPNLEKLPEFIKNEVRFSSLAKLNPKESPKLVNQLISDCTRRYQYYSKFTAKSNNEN